MTLSPRSLLATGLFVVASVPILLWIVSQSAPDTAVEWSLAGRTLLGQLLWIGAAALVVMALLYPPFVPWVRVWWRRTVGRMSTDRLPLLEALDRLKNFETAVDHDKAGSALAAAGRQTEAIPHFVRSIELEPQSAGVRYRLGRALLDAGDPVAAAGALQSALQLDSDHAFGQALLEYGVALERAGQSEQAVTVLAEHEQKFGEQPRTLYVRAKALSAEGDREQAMELLKRAAEPPASDRPVPPEEKLWRARAKVALWRKGSF